MDDKLIASYLETDGTKNTYMPHLENSEASWDSGTGLTLSSEGRERFFPSHRILEVNRFTEPDSYAWYSLQNDPVIEQFWDGDTAELRAVLDQLSTAFEKASFEELKQYIQQHHSIESDAVIGALVRIALTSEMVDHEEPVEMENGKRPATA